MPWAAVKGPVIAAIIIAAVLLVGGFLTLGIPGAIYAIPAAPVVELILQRPFGSLFDGDRAWGMAILLTLCVPPIIPLLIWFGLWRFNANIWWALLITLVGMWIWSIALLLWVSLQ
jgi:hypothetical protein